MALLFFTHCKEEPLQPLVQEKSALSKSVTNLQTDSLKISALVTVDSVKSKDKIKGGGGIVPLAPVCGTLDKYLWEFDHYEAAPGKIVGILPTHERSNNVSRLAEIKNKWGFNYVHCMEGDLVNLYAAGYSSTNLMLLLDPGESIWQNVINNHPETFWAYYVDEPWSRNNEGRSVIPVATMEAAKAYVDWARPSSLFIEGETTTGPATYYINTADYMLCTRYDNYPQWYDTDQRPLWQAFKDAFQTKFSMSWIGAHKDLNDYDELIGNANSHSFNAIWLYQLEDATDSYSDNNISTFSHYAWKWGWMRKFERQWIYVYRCSKPDPCDCNRTNINDGWELERKYETPALREVYF